jgi:hypothetical protein
LLDKRELKTTQETIQRLQEAVIRFEENKKTAHAGQLPVDPSNRMNSCNHRLWTGVSNTAKGYYQPGKAMQQG